MSVGKPGKHRKTKNHKGLRSAKNKRTGKYAKQSVRTAANKAKKRAR